MTIEQRTLSILEYPKIRERLAEHTSFSASRELALSLLPDDEIGSVRRAQRATSAARALFDAYPDITIGGARDIRQPVRLTVRGGLLEPPVLLEAAATLEAMRQLRTRLLKLPDDPYGPLLDLAYALPELPELESAIWRTVDPGGGILDSASPALGKLRAEIRIAHGRLMDRLNAIIGSSQYASALQEPIITMRDGRYVIPIKATGRRTLRGIVHDQSNTGATLFVEPLQTVELTNDWRELQIAEQQEIVRILQMLSAQIGEHGREIIDGVTALAELDLLFAKARYSVALNAFEPRIVDSMEAASERAEDAPLYLRKARHPLLNPETVVPTDVWLGGTFRVLLITGPNTGGKTVALKTTGLLALMAQAGLHIPAADRSRLPIFRHIFADIGDEQSIEQSLSTFSSHMTHIISILRSLDEAARDDQHGPATLALFDELGAGTDPTEGAALARAIIERVLESGALCIGTTHYAELKAYAHNTPGVVNGSVEFDQETLRPTYKLEIGLPGRSNALAIASRLGLEPALIDRARSFLSSEDEQVEDLLTSIAREREAAAAEQQQAQAMREEAEQMRAQLQEELDQLERERDQRIQAFERQLDDELRATRQELRRLREDTRSVSLTREWLQQAEERLKAVGESAEQQRQQRRRQRPPRPQIPAGDGAQSAASNAPQAPRPFQVGDRVHVASVKLDGEILSIDQQAGEAEVQVGGFRMTVDLRELRRLKGNDHTPKAAQTPAPAPRVTGPARDVSMQLDMRGMRASEIESLLDRYLNDAYLSNLSEVRLVHGKGTGALRKIVRDVLSTHPLVTSYAGGVDGEGGEGVTVARLQRR
jgi:DNA mismatch repair protein MutS2